MSETNRSTKEILYEYFMTYWCGDDAENRNLVKKWNAEISDEAKALHDECIIIDGCSFNIETYNWQLQEGRPTALNMTIPMVHDPSASGWHTRLTDVLHAVTSDPDHFMHILTTDDIEEAKRTGKVGLIMGAQTCDFIRSGDIESSVFIYHRLGLRIMQIAYHTRSFAADGCDSGTNVGITNQGRQMIRAMEKFGITVDLAHVGERSTLEAMEMAEKPMIFSHTNPLKMFNHIRNITDEQAKKCAATGGLVGSSSFAPILWDGENFPTVDRLVDSIVYFADLCGIDHVGFGLDYNAEPGAYLRRNARSIAEAFFGPNAPDNTLYDLGYKQGRGKASVFTEGMYGIANCPKLVDTMLKRGFSHEDVKKVMGGNFLRVFKETWAK